MLTNRCDKMSFLKNTLFLFLYISLGFFNNTVLTENIKIARRKPIQIEKTPQEDTKDPKKRTGRKPAQRNPAKKNPAMNMNPAKQQALQQGLMVAQNVLAQADGVLKEFEAVLDRINTVMTQKVGTNKIKNPLKTQSAIRHLAEIRTMLFSLRSNLMEKAPQSPLELPQFINGIGLHVYLSIHTAEYVYNLLKSRFRYFKPFDQDLMRHMIRGQKIPQQKTIGKNIRVLAHYLKKIDTIINDFDLTTVNKVARFLDRWLISPFFKYSLNDILFYAVPASIAGGYLIAWKGIAGWYTKYKEMQYLIENGSISNTKQNNWYSRIIEHKSGTLSNGPDIPNIFIDKKNGIFTTEKNKNNDYIITGFNPDFEKSQNKLQQFGYYLRKKFGNPEEVYSSFPGIVDQEVAKFFERSYRELVGRGKETKLTGIDRAMTSYLSGAYPLVAVPLGMALPSLKEFWDKKIYPTITANVQALFNKLMGGVFEEKIVEGNWEIATKHTLDDFIGMEDKVEELKLVIEYFINPERYAHMKGKITKAFLLTGETRTGKTFLVEAFVGSLQKRLVQMGRSPASVATFNLPVSAIQQIGISGVLKHIKTKAPAIVFIDEVDLIGLQRNTNTTVLSDFLTGMTPLLDEDPTKTVILFCATNKAETLDKALRTVGRFGKEVRFDYPAFRYRKAFLEREFKRLGINTKDVDFNKLTRQLDQVPYEKINYILHNAILQASIKGTPFSQKIFERTIDAEVREIIPKNRKDLDIAEKEILATHFAAHILCFLLLKMSRILDSITIQAVQPKTGEEFIGADQFRKEDEKPKKIVFGATFANKNGDSEGVMTYELLLNEIKQLLSGFMAEEIMYGASAYSYHQEFYEEARKKALNHVCKGMKFNELPEQQKAEYTAKAIKLLEKCARDIKTLLEENKDLLEFMQQTLLQYETLSGTEVKEHYETFLQEKKKKEQVVDTTIEETGENNQEQESKENQDDQSLELLKNTDESVDTEVKTI